MGGGASRRVTPFGQWLIDNGWTHEACAAEIERNRRSVSRWASGARRPCEEDQRVIFLFTDGVIDGNAWYPIEDWRAQLADQRAARRGAAA